MAAGSIMTGGLSILAGVIAYKALSSEARSLDSLSTEEVRIIESSSILIAAIDDLHVQYSHNVKTVYLPKDEAISILENFLYPLQDTLLTYKKQIMSQLDSKHKLLNVHDPC